MINLRMANLCQITPSIGETEVVRLTLRREKYILFRRRVQSIRSLLFQFIIQNSMCTWSPAVMETVILLTSSLEPGNICDEVYWEKKHNYFI